MNKLKVKNYKSILYNIRNVPKIEKGQFERVCKPI